MLRTLVMSAFLNMDPTHVDEFIKSVQKEMNNQ